MIVGLPFIRQCGHPVAPQIPTFRLIDGPFVDGERQRVVKAAAGITFSVVLTDDGKGACALTYYMPPLSDEPPSFFLWKWREGAVGKW